MFVSRDGNGVNISKDNINFIKVEDIKELRVLICQLETEYESIYSEYRKKG